MNSMIGKSTGIALLMAAALLAALFAMGVFSATGVGADVSEDDPTPTIGLSSRVPSASGVTMTLTFKIDAAIAAGEPIRMTFPGFTANDVGFNIPVDDVDTEGVNEASTVTVKQGENKVLGLTAEVTGTTSRTVTISPSTDTPPTPADGEIALSAVVLTEELVVTIDKVTNPAISDEYDATLAQGSQAALTAQVSIHGATLSSNDPGAAVRIKIDQFADAEVPPGDDIVINLKDFGVPSTITESQVLFGDAGDVEGVTTTSYVGNPSEVSVSGKKITLTTPATKEDGTSHNAVTGPYTIVFKQSAGISNPNTGGDKTIELTDKDGDPTASKFTVTIDRVIKLDKSKAKRGTEITVTGKGFTSGRSATVYLQQVKPDGTTGEDGMPGDVVTDADGDPAPNVVLGTASVTDGSFTLAVDTTSPDFKSGFWTDGETKKGLNLITAIDGSDKTADKTAHFQVTGTVSAEPENVSHAEVLTIKVSDWPDTEVRRVTIGGQPAALTSADGNTLTTQVVAVTNGNATIYVEVPGKARLGTQTVSVYKDADSASTGSSTVSVGSLDLDLNPATAARGERVTINGSGFDPNRTVGFNSDIVKVTVSGKDVKERVGTFDIVTGGGVTFSVTVPINTSAIRDGDNTVKVEAWDGRIGTAKLSIPEATITLDPTEGRRGTSVGVTGTGFIANELVLVTYGSTGDASKDTRVGSALADSRGNIDLSFDVPASAQIGKEEKVTAEARVTVDNVEVVVDAQATHTTPEAVVTADPSDASPGDSITISGANLPLHSNVSELKIGDTDVTPSPKPLTDGNGSFSATVTVPQLELGNETITVKMGEATYSGPIKIVAESAIPAPTDPAEVFADLVEAGRLARVWYQDRATQDWTFYDPDPAFASFNRLNEVSSGQVVTIIITDGEPIPFQGETLYQGSNSIALD